jgi:DNA-binding beta-propeller fold protein YncE
MRIKKIRKNGFGILGGALIVGAIFSTGCASSSSSSATSTASPTITSVSPSTGVVWGGGTVTIVGTGFSTSATVKLGETTCTSPTATETQITCTIAPDATAGAKTVSVYDGSTVTASLVNGFTMKTDTYTTVASLAGAPAVGGFKDGTGTAAYFYSPNGVVFDTDSLYVADSGNHVIRKVVVATGVVTVFAGTVGTPGSTDGTGTAAKFNSPNGIDTDGTNLYVSDSDNHTIRKIVISTGEVTTLAGTAGSVGYTDGTGSAARFYYPRGVTVLSGNLYVADSATSIIRKIVVATGVVTTFAGSAFSNGYTDATSTSARFYSPYGITNDGTDLYLTDSTANNVRKIVVGTQAVTTFAGSTAGTAGSTDAVGTAARFRAPQGIFRVGTDLYVADTGNYTVRGIVIADGTVSTTAGSGSAGIADGAAGSATFYGPSGIASDGTNLYITESSNNTVRKLDGNTAVVSVFAGNTAGFAASWNNVDATGTAARFRHIQGMATDGTNIYVSDSTNNNIRKVVIASGVVTTLAGGGVGNAGNTDGTGTDARFNNPRGLATDGTNLYVADFGNHLIRKVVIATGVVTTVAGSGTGTVTDGTGTAASFYYPSGVALSSDNANLYVAEYYGADIRKMVVATGVVTSVAGVSMSIGTQDGVGTDSSTGAKFGYLSALTSDGTYLYAVDSLYSTVRKIDPATGVVRTLAGWPGSSGQVDSTGTAGRFRSPTGVSTDGVYVYVADSNNHVVRKVDIATGVITTVFGSMGKGQDIDGAVATTAYSFYPLQVLWHAAHGLFVANPFNIRKAY